MSSVAESGAAVTELAKLFRTRVRLRRFNLCGGADPVSETLLGPVSEWQPTGCIAYTRPAGPIVGLTRFSISDDLR